MSPDATGPDFIQSTKYQNLRPSPEKEGEPFPIYISEFEDESALIPLPAPAELEHKQLDFLQLITDRRSLRRYDMEASLTLEELSYLLWCTQGVKFVSEHKFLTVRTVPSAGSRHPFETYLAISRVEGLEPGLYRFIAQKHALVLVRPGQMVMNEVSEAGLKQAHMRNAAVDFLWVAHIYRTSWRYSARAYRYIYLDAGHVCQNLYLAAETIGYGVCAIAAYDDDQMDALLGLDGTNAFCAYIATVGKRLPEG